MSFQYIENPTILSGTENVIKHVEEYMQLHPDHSFNMTLYDSCVLGVVLENVDCCKFGAGEEADMLYQVFGLEVEDVHLMDVGYLDSVSRYFSDKDSILMSLFTSRCGNRICIEAWLELAKNAIEKYKSF